MNLARHLKERAALGLAEQSAYRFLVYSGVGVTKVKSGATGRVIYRHAEASTAIQWALDHLTPERQHKEKVVVMGDFTLADRLLIPSYTVINLIGSLTPDNGVFTGTGGDTGDYGILQCASRVNGVTDVDIEGGTLIGNYVNQTGKSDGIHFAKSQRIRIAGVTIIGARNEGIELANECEDFWIERCYLDNCGDDGISILNSSRGTVIGNVSKNHRDATGGSKGIEIEDGTHHVTISNNTIVGSVSGIGVITDPGGGDTCFSINIFNNSVEGPSSSGIMATTQKAGEFVTGINIVGNVVRNCGTIGIDIINGEGCTINGNYVTGSGTIGMQFNNSHRCNIFGNTTRRNQTHGIQLYGATYNLVAGNVATDNDQVAGTGYGINVTNESTDNLLVGNVFTDSVGSGSGTQDRGIRINANDNVVIGNHLKNNRQLGLVVSSGTGLIIRDNTSYITENNGTATVPNGATSVVVNHGLSATPALDDISVTPTNNLGNAAKFWISNPTATQFTINVDADPGASTATFVWSASIQ